MKKVKYPATGGIPAEATQVCYTPMALADNSDRKNLERQ
jgi:hypothetical protein